MGENIIVGLIEEVLIKGKSAIKTHALFDTGAQSTSVDIELASKACLGPVMKMTRIKNPSVRHRVSRPVVRATIIIDGKEFRVNVNLQDRSHMNFPVIIGRNIISGNFLVDASRNAHLFKEKEKKKAR